MCSNSKKGFFSKDRYGNKQGEKKAIKKMLCKENNRDLQ